MTARRRWSATKWVSLALSLFALLSLVLLVALFVQQSLPVWRQEGWGFLTGKKWFYRQEEFGIASMLYGTVAVALIALGLAAPLGIGAAVFTAEFLPARLRLAVKIAIELLSGIPSVVYGLLGILLLRDWVYETLQPFDPLSGDTLLTGGILLGIMILPTIMTLSDDALRSVPASQRLAARALGLNSTEAVLGVSLRQAVPGIFAAVFLAIGRACGEMIAVFLVVGRQDNQWPEKLLSLQPLIDAGQTLSTKLGSSETNIAYGDPLHWAAMVALGLVLLVLVTIVTAIGVRLQRSPKHSHHHGT
ncbi:MAG: phosphate ABC transporter permease subunit PstC [Verrucomicrobiota bacterium]